MRKRFSRAIHVSLALLIVLALVVMPTPRSASAGAVGAVVDLVLLPSSQTVDIGDIFDITIEAQCNGQDVCGVATLKFNRSQKAALLVTSWYLTMIMYKAP